MFLKTSSKEIFKIAVGSAVMMLLMMLVFALSGNFSAGVVWGSLLGVFAAVVNFVLLAITLEFSLGRGARKAQGLMGLSYTARLAVIAVIVIFAIRSPKVNYIAAVIPLVFPRILIMLYNFASKRKKEEAELERTEDTL